MAGPWRVPSAGPRVASGPDGQMVLQSCAPVNAMDASGCNPTSRAIGWSAFGMKERKGRGTLSTVDVSPGVSSILPKRPRSTSTECAEEPRQEQYQPFDRRETCRTWISCASDHPTAARASTKRTALAWAAGSNNSRSVTNSTLGVTPTAPAVSAMMAAANSSRSSDCVATRMFN